MSIGAAPPICGHCHEVICRSTGEEAKPSFHADCLQILHDTYPGSNFCLEKSMEHIPLNPIVLGVSAAAWPVMGHLLMTDTTEGAKGILKTGALLVVLVILVASVVHSHFHDS